MQQLSLANTHDYTPRLVSVVIPTYNQVDFVRETIDSVLMQDYPHLQIIVTDDGSTDGTAQIIQNYANQHPDKVIAVLSEKNTGIPANLNRGLRKASGEYVAWLGGDDLMLPGKISKQVALMEMRPDAVGCCHDAEVFQSHDAKVLGLFSELNNGHREFREGGVELWFASNYFMLPSTMMVRSLAIPAHGFDERLKYVNDWLLDVEIFRNGKCAPLNEVLGRYRRHANNVTGSTDLKGIGIEENMIALAIIENRYPELYGYIHNQRKRAYLASAVKSFRNKDLSGSKNNLLIAIRNGAVLRGTLLSLVLMLFGSHVLRQLSLPLASRSTVFIKLESILRKI
jgi:glycosyltransferase involved in cell wall biosynthesis